VESLRQLRGPLMDGDDADSELSESDPEDLGQESQPNEEVQSYNDTQDIVDSILAIRADNRKSIFILMSTMKYPTKLPTKLIEWMQQRHVCTEWCSSTQNCEFSWHKRMLCSWRTCHFCSTKLVARNMINIWLIDADYIWTDITAEVQCCPNTACNCVYFPDAWATTGCGPLFFKKFVITLRTLSRVMHADDKGTYPSTSFTAILSYLFDLYPELEDKLF
jgi:hypothetical protein